MSWGNGDKAPKPQSQHFLSLGPDGFHRVAYVDWGAAEHTHVVVCVHGLSRNSRDFDFLAADLARDCRVVAMDVVGRGESEWLADKSGYCFPTYLQDAAALLARITMPSPPDFFGELRNRLRRRQPTVAIDWIGTSMGGLIGLMLAARRNSPIRRLVLNDVGPFVPWNALIGLKGHLGGDRRFASLPAAADWFRTACAEFGRHDDSYWQHMAEHGVIEDGDGGFRLRYDPGIVRGLPVHRDPEFPIGPEFLRGIDLWALWDQVRCPVLVLRGADSAVLPAEVVAEMQRRKPELEVAEFAGVGHVPALATPDQIARVRAFLQPGR